MAHLIVEESLGQPPTDAGSARVAKHRDECREQHGARRTGSSLAVGRPRAPAATAVA